MPTDPASIPEHAMDAYFAAMRANRNHAREHIAAFLDALMGDELVPVHLDAQPFVTFVRLSDVLAAVLKEQAT